MKKILFFIFVLGYTHTVLAQTNKYYNANESWIQTDLGMTMGQPNSITTKCFFVNGDSVIGSKIFKKVFGVSRSWTGSAFSGYSGSFVDPAYLVKEENDTVMILSILSPDAQTDTSWIFYDFNASLVYFRYFYSDALPVYGLGSAGMGSIFDSIVINGVPRRIFYSEGETYEGAFGTSWSSRVEPYTNPPQLDGFRHLQCYAGNDSVYIDYSGEVWPGNPYVLDPPVPGNCNIDNVYWSDVENHKTPTIIIFPNPTSDLLYISISTTNLPTYLMINSLGQPMAIRKIDDDILDIALLPRGVYTLQINDGKASYFRKFIKD